MDTISIVFTALGITSAFLILSGYISLKRRTRTDELVQRRADRAADAAHKAGGYDELIELERHRRNGWRSMRGKEVVSSDEKEKI